MTWLDRGVVGLLAGQAVDRPWLGAASRRAAGECACECVSVVWAYPAPTRPAYWTSRRQGLAGPPPLEHRPTARPVMSSGQFEKAEISLLKEDGKVASRHMFGFEFSEG